MRVGADVGAAMAAMLFAARFAVRVLAIAAMAAPTGSAGEPL